MISTTAKHAVRALVRDGSNVEAGQQLVVLEASIPRATYDVLVAGKQRFGAGDVPE